MNSKDISYEKLVSRLFSSEKPSLEFEFYKGHKVVKPKKMEDIKYSLEMIKLDWEVFSEDSGAVGKEKDRLKVNYEYCMKKILEFGGNILDYPKDFTKYLEQND